MRIIMPKKACRKVTIIYYSDLSLELMHVIESFPQNENGRVILPMEFKANKSIVAVCDGEVSILNKIGDKIQATESNIVIPSYH